MGKSSENNKSNKTSSYTDFYYHFFRNILIVTLPLLVISAFILSLPHSSADSSSDTVKLSVPVSCTLSSHINTGEEHTISMVSGTYEDEIGITTLTTYCNDPGGFVIYANGNSNNIEGNNKITSTLGSTYDIPSGTATSGDISQWAMKLTAVNSSTPADTPTIATGYNSYSTVPDQWTKVVYKDAGTMNVETGSSFTTTYAIYLKGLQPAGTYSGQVKYVMLYPSTTGAPASTINEAFANANKTPVLALDPETGQMGSFYKMQDMNSGICESVAGSNESTTARLVDVRDNKLYYVTKLQDGNCWMTQNLALDLETTPTNVAPLTSENTDLNDNSLSGAYELGYTYENNIITWKPANETTSFSGTTVSWINSNTTPSSATKTDGVQSGHQAAGNYYNWSAAIASNNSSTYSASTYSDVSKNPENSICPKGWRLPTVSSVAANNDFKNLNNLYNSGSTTSDAGLITAPLWFVKSGVISNKTLNSFSTEGFYWPSTTYSSILAYYLKFNSNSTEVGSDWWYVTNRSSGGSLRCVAR